MERKSKLKAIDHNQYRQALLDGVVKSGAKYDLGGITNQTIADMSSQSEPYIYRYFNDRDDLIEKAFFRSDENFFAALSRNVHVLHNRKVPLKQRVFDYLNTCWDYMVEDYTYCKFYVRYYYSNANTAKFRAKHREIGQTFYSHIKSYFKPEMDVDLVMHQLFSTVIWNVMDAAIGIVKDTPEQRKRIFSMMYSIIEPNLIEVLRHENG